MGDYRFPSFQFQFPIRALYSHPSTPDDCEFVKLRDLARFRPSFGAAQAGNTQVGTLAVDVANIFVNELRFSLGGLNASGLSQKRGHAN